MADNTELEAVSIKLETSTQTTDSAPVSTTRRLITIGLIITFVLCFIGTVVGIPLAATLGKCKENSPEIEGRPPEGWLSWTEWTECSSTCGIGKIVRSRKCVSHTPGSESTVCEGYMGSDELEVHDCTRNKCLSGDKMVMEVTDRATEAGVEDYLFLSRYAQAVTLNGEQINPGGSNSIGYGTWRLTSNQLNEILPRSAIERVDSITNNLISNANFVCELELEKLTLVEAQVLADTNPCFSLVALTTLLVVRNHYPLPLDFGQQEAVLNQITDQIQMKWQNVLDKELETLQKDCLQSDIDFDFVIDSSGSVGAVNWATTMRMIGQNWIKELLVPNGSKTCGNHVAGRWFSSNTLRFHDFEPPGPGVYAPKTYANYVGDIFIGYPYYSGGTETGKALKQTRILDMPLARNGLKYAMVFTDGVSSNYAETVKESKLLHSVANRTYAMGIGSDINKNELFQIASDPRYVGNMTRFSDLKAFVRIFVKEQKGCATTNKQAYRAGNLNTTVHHGMSWQTAKQLGNLVSPQCAESSVCPFEVESNRQKTCVTCSAEIVELHKPLLNQIWKNVTVAASTLCFPPEIVLALVSRLSIENGNFVQSPTNDGWRQCILDSTKWSGEDCYGLMHIPRSHGADGSLGVDSVEHFINGLQYLLELTNNVATTFNTYTVDEQTRGGIAAYDAGLSAAADKHFLDVQTTNGDFSADVLARAKHIAYHDLDGPDYEFTTPWSIHRETTTVHI